MSEGKEKQIQRYLCSILKNQFDICNDSELSSASLLVDILLDCLQFVYNEGLSESKMITYLHFFHGFLEETVFKELPMEKAVALLRTEVDKLCSSGNFKSDFLNSSVDYICLNVIQHYQLLVYAMCYQRDEDVHIYNALVETIPADISPLFIGVPLDIWTCEQNIKYEESKLLAQEKATNEVMLAANSVKLKELDACMKSWEEVCSESVTVSDLEEILKAIIVKHSELTAAQLDGVLEHSKQILLFKHEKNKLMNKTRVMQMKKIPLSPSRKSTSKPKKR